MRPSRVLAATLFTLALSAVPVAAEDNPPPPPSPCVQQCTTDAKTTYMSCVAGGGSGEQCGQTARAQYLQCTAGCPTPPPPPPSGTPCLEQCGAQAEQAFRTCREQGGTVESCTASAKASYLQCAATNCANQQPPTCDARCTAVADGMEQRCLQEGNDAATCTAVRQAALDRCKQELCNPTGESCEDRCTAFARGVFAQCTAAGLRAGVITGAADLEACLGSDAHGRIARASRAGARLVRARCRATPVATACPAECTQVSLDDLFACVARPAVLPSLQYATGPLPRFGAPDAHGIG